MLRSVFTLVPNLLLHVALIIYDFVVVIFLILGILPPLTGVILLRKCFSRKTLTLPKFMENV